MLLKKTLLWFFGLLFAAAIILSIFLYWKNFSIDLSALRPSLNKIMTDTLNQPVKIQGALELRLSLTPSVVINTIQISGQQNPDKITLIQNINIHFDLSNLSLKDWLQLLQFNAVLPVHIRATLANTILSANGTITHQDNQLSSDLAISLKGQQLNEINFFSTQALIDIGPYSIDAELQQQQQSINLKNIAAEFGDLTLSGDFSYENIKQRHLIKANLKTPTLRLPPLQDTETQITTQKIDDGISVLNDIDFTLSFKIDALPYEKKQIKEVELKLAFEHGKTKNAQLTSNINGTPVSATFSVDMQDLISKAGTSNQAKINTDILLSATTHQAHIQAAFYYPSTPTIFEINAVLKGTELNNLSGLVETKLPHINNYTIKTQLYGKNNEYSFTDISANMEETNFAGNLTINNDNDRPHIAVNIDIDNIDIDNIAIADAASPGTQHNNNHTLPYLDTVNADVNLNISKLSSQYVTANNIFLSGRLDNNQVTPVTFKFNTGHTLFSGNLSILFPKGGNNPPALNLNLSAQNFYLSEINIAKQNWPDLDIQSPQVNLSINTEGNTVDEWLSTATGRINASKGEYKATNTTNEPSVNIPLKNIKLNLKPEMVISSATAIVKAEEIPLSFEFSLSRPKALSLPTEPLDLQLKILNADSKLTVKLASALPFDWQQQVYFTEIEGKNFSDLNILFDSTLPNIGPYTLNAQLKLPENGVELRHATATINTTVLEGNFNYHLINDEPAIQATIRADYVNLADIEPNNSTVTNTTKNKNQHNLPKSTDQATVAYPILNALFNIHKNLATKNLDINLSLKNAETEGIEFHDIQIGLTSGNGQLELKPIEISYLDGKISSELRSSTVEERYSFEFKARTDNLDYSFLSTFLDGDTSAAKGALSTNIELVAKAPTYEQLVNNLNGHINVILWPEIISSYMLEIWGEGIVRSTLAAFVSAEKHKFNCIVGYFDIENGVMRSRALYIDTSRLVINGSGTVNLLDKQIDIVVQPKAKQAQILTNEVPMQITGTWNNYKVQPEGGIVKGGILGSIVRVPKNIITFPYRAVTDIIIPENSQIKCASVN